MASLNPLKLIEEWITEHGSAAIQGKHIAFLKDQISPLREQLTSLEKQVADLSAEKARLEAKVSDLEKKCESLGRGFNQLPDDPSLIEQVVLGALQNRLAGVAIADISDGQFRAPDLAVVADSFVEWGLCERIDGGIRITPKGRDYARRIFR